MKNDLHQLSEPPRRVSILVQLSVLFGGFHNNLGWVLLVLGLAYRDILTPGTSLIFSISGVLLICGIYQLSRGLSKGVFARRLLMNGELTKGRIYHWESTTWKISKKTVVVYVFEYMVENRQYLLHLKSYVHERLKDDEEEPLLYDSARPKRSLALGNLPIELEVGHDGDLAFVTGTRMIRLLKELLLPAISIVGIIVYFAWEFGLFHIFQNDIQHLFP